MGKAARWFRSLLGGGKKQDPSNQGKQDSSHHRRPAAPAPAQDRKRWSFARSSSRDSVDSASAASTGGGGNAAIARAAEAAWLKSMYAQGGGDPGQREQSKHAIAVAAATAAAADAAVAAAQAAVEVVRLTSQGPGFGSGGLDPRGRAGAAVKIQTAFRGFLAKKALRALKALVKLQALVRGYLVRRQAAATLQSMQALVRAQAAVRAARCSRAAPVLPPLPVHHHLPPLIRPRFSLQERYADDTRSDHGGVAAPSYSRRLSVASIETASYYDRSPKIVEMDTGRPTPRSRASSSHRTTTSPALLPDAGADEWWSVSSPLPHPPRIAVPSPRGDHDYWCVQEKPRPATAQCTPRCTVPLYAPATPSKSPCGGGGGKGYMSSTQSSEAKTNGSSRSQSAPRQRPETARKRVPLSEVVLMEARASLSGVNVQRPCTQAFDFRKAVVSRFERGAAEEMRDRNDVFLQTRW